MRRKSVGFTLLEALVVMAILSLTVIAVPPMVRWLNRQGVGHAVNQIQADIQLARMMAINQQTTCTIQFNQPGRNQYHNLLNGQRSSLAIYRGGVHFLEKGPDGNKMTEHIAFNGQGLSMSVVPANIFIADEDMSSIYRLRILLPGGVSRYRWQAGRWQ